MCVSVCISMYGMFLWPQTPLLLSHCLQSWLILPVCCLCFSHLPESCVPFLTFSFLLSGSLSILFDWLSFSLSPLFLVSQMASGWSVITSRRLNSSTWPHRRATSWPSTTWPRCMPLVLVWCAPATLLWRWATLLLLPLHPVKIKRIERTCQFLFSSYSYVKAHVLVRYCQSKSDISMSQNYC